VPPADEPADDEPADDEPADEPPPADDEPADEPPPADDEPADEPPPADDEPADDEPADEISLQTAFEQCAFNMVWTRGLHFNSGLPIGASLLDQQDADSLVFAPDNRNAWVFPGIAGGESVLTLALIGVDDTTGEYLVTAVVENATQRLVLPTLSLDVDQPIVLVDATVQNPEAVGQAVLTSLVDGTESSYEIEWGLVVDLNGGDGISPLGACEPILETVYGPLD